MDNTNDTNITENLTKKPKAEGSITRLNSLENANPGTNILNAVNSSTNAAPYGNSPDSKPDGDDASPNPKADYVSEPVPTNKISNFTYDRQSFFVDGLLKAGLTIFGGPMKGGAKSWFLLYMALCIAKGKIFLGRMTKQVGVLYIHPEDVSQKIRKRIDILLDEDAPENFDTASAVDMKESTILTGIDRYLAGHPDTKVIIIDSLQKIRASRPIYRDDNDFGHEYRILASLKRIADKYGAAIILVTHCRKIGDKDGWVNKIAEVVSPIGTVDTLMFLARRKHKPITEWQLRITGRELPESDMSLKMNPDNITWEYTGSERN